MYVKLFVGAYETPQRRLHRLVIRSLCVLACVCFVLLSLDSTAQIGGKSSSDGPFTLDNVEDLNTTAAGVDRAWIPDYIYTNPDAFKAVSLTTSGLTTTLDQTTTGALCYAMPTQPKGGYVSYSFGVPMPAQPGASTLTHPGDISSFTQMTFLIRGSHILNDQVSQVILETYPGPSYPKLYWNFALPVGSAFQRISINLRDPSLVTNAGTWTIDQLLSATRYMSLYFYGGKETIPKTLTVHVDDIQLVGQAAAAVNNWSLY